MLRRAVRGLHSEAFLQHSMLVCADPAGSDLEAELKARSGRWKPGDQLKGLYKLRMTVDTGPNYVNEAKKTLKHLIHSSQ